MAKSRNYAREYKLYHSKPKQIKRRAQRNAARRVMAKKGAVRKGDGKDVHHVSGSTANNKASNLRAISKHRNRSFHRKGAAKGRLKR